METIISDELLREAGMGGYTVRILQDSIMMAHRVTVSPDIESMEPITHFTTEVISWEHFSWHGTWWAKALRWLDKRIDLPAAITWIACGLRPTTNLVHRDLPEDLLKRIRVQQFEMDRRGEKPTMVLMGQKALYEIKHHPELPIESLSYPCKIFGLELRHSPWLTEDAVLVV